MKTIPGTTQLDSIEGAVRLAVLGVLVGSGGFVSYSIIFSRIGTVSAGTIGTLDLLAFTSLAATLAGLIGVSIGVWRVMGAGASHDGALVEFPSSTLGMLFRVTSNKSYRRLALVATMTYGLIYAVISGIVVYQPAAAFSRVYGVKVPTTVLVLCCGAIGEMPRMVLFPTEHLGFLIVPTNLVLLFLVSWLVGLNFALAVFAYRNASSRGGERQWFASIGAFLGLFTACPTCASLLLSTLTGTAAAISLALLLDSLQTAFIAFSIPLLLATLFLNSRRLANVGDTCGLSSDKPE